MSRRPAPPLRSASNDSAVTPLGSPPLQQRRPTSSKAHHTRGASSTVADTVELARLTDYLTLDARPTFVLAGPGKQPYQGKPVFVNAALQNAAALLSLVQTALKELKGTIGSPDLVLRPKESAGSSSKSRGSKSGALKSPRQTRDGYFPPPAEVRHGGHPTLQTTSDNPDFVAFLLPGRGATANTTTRWKDRTWRRVILPSGWVIVHCESYSEPVPDERDEVSDAKASADSNAVHSSPNYHRAMVDWTRDTAPSPNPWIRFLRDFDWASTPLGPMAHWPWELRAWVNMLMSDPFPGVILWGSELTLIYNHACMQLFVERHPSALGGDPRLAFGDVWHHMTGMIDRVRTTGRTTEHHNLCLPLQRHGRVEETYWSIAIMPILGHDGRVHAIYDRFTETTSLNIAERRQKTLARLGELGGQSRDLKDLWGRILRAIDINTQTPYAIIYSVSSIDKAGETAPERSILPSGSQQATRVCELEGMMGVPDDHDGIPRKLHLSNEEHEMVPFLRQAWLANEPVLMSKENGTLPGCLDIRHTNRGFADECVAAVIIPVRFALENRLAAFVIHALNPRRPYDVDYKGYMTLMQTRIVELAANIFLPEEDRRTQAALRKETLRQATLASRLLSKTHEAEQKQMRFMRLAENAPIGMVMYDAEGQPLFYNDAYFEIFGLRQETYTPHAWLDAIHPDDRERVLLEWRKLIEEGIPVTIEHRVIKPWRSVDPVNGSEVIGETWLLSSAIPEITGMDLSGPPQIMGWLIDISHQKWAEKLQRQRLEDALENKRQSENFIDMTSHEMRNPLSAILQSADGINTAVAAALGDVPDPAGDTAISEQLQAIAENARNIVLCAQHQKRIVDDILTLSKLDSNLLLITPDQASPLEIVRHVLKMYEAELVNSSVEVSVSIDDSYEKLGIQMVLLDPSRLLQVLINLLTNAIKFTQFQARRRIVIYLSASREKPSGAPNGVKFFPINLNRSKTHFSMSMPSDENPVYLMFAVQDSGRGLTENEHKMLFHRFSQANPRTHVQYGGSGLGLFISRELTELQGGQIGVSSAPEQGSTFAFYIKSYKCDASRSGTEEGSIATSAAHAPHLTLPFTTTGLHRIPMLDRSITSPAAPSMIAEAGSTTHPSAAWGTARRPSLIEPILHVLVVEDNVINQRVMAKQLQRAGCVVHVANHGGEALEFLWRSKLVVLERNDSGCDVSADAIVNTTLEATDVVGARRSSHTPATLPVGSEQRQLSGAGIAGKTPEKPSLDVILMDIEMPIMDGLTCVREIRSLQRSRKLWRHVPIICITANAREAQIEEARGVGCDLVVTKPFRIPEILPRMQRLVGEWREKERAATEAGVVAR